MTTSESYRLRAVRCKHWHWLPGMLTDLDERLTDEQVRDGSFLGVRPNLDDSVTRQLLHSLVRQAWGRQVRVWLSPVCDGGYYVAETVFVYRPEDIFGVGPTGAAALVSALESAP